ncbi:AAA family ATPase, partial [Promineifilum sp.]|uniref:ATP-binding protein n=1 Tax=Promineifilum sp. TaxID=2664178 RepID=UPI0035ADF244
SAAEPGTILISHNTYRHVRGVFDVQPRDPITVKGVEGPVQTYVVLRAKPRAFRMATRGVEGIETRMVGRETEMLALQTAYADALDSSETRVVTVVGEAGVGKSRLLYEFDNWLELRPETVWYFKGRATPNLRNVPHSLFRDLFAFRFQILDSDSAAVALEKFRAGMAGALEAARADIIGHWLGFDFSASEAIKSLLGGGDLGAIGRAYLTRYFRALAAAGPLVILLEDLHWADEQSLDLVAHLVGALPAAPLLVVCAARPVFLERRPGWGKGEAAFRRIQLMPLSKRASRMLVDEILRRVDEVPDSLRELIIDAAEGNPFYVEEMVKMLIEQGVIERPLPNPLPRGEGVRSPSRREGLGEGAWRVKVEKLATLKVPPTLTALLQARLDGLPRPEREALQRASVVGRLFWDDAVADLMQTERNTIAPTLAAVRKRELIFRREHSSFVDADEYIFKHALLRDVAYETVLRKYRAESHGRVARWLEVHAGERLGEYLGLIAEHYVQAGEGLKAAALLERSGYEAAEVGLYGAARRALERALALREAAGETDGPAVARATIALGEACVLLGDYPAAEAALERGLVGALAAGDRAAAAEARTHLARSANTRGHYDRARILLEAALPEAQAVGGRTLVVALLAATDWAWATGDLTAAETLARETGELAQATGDLTRESQALNYLGAVATSRHDLEEAERRFQESLVVARRANNPEREATVLINLGSVAEMRGDFGSTSIYAQSALSAFKELGDQFGLLYALQNLALVTLRLGDPRAARDGAGEMLGLAHKMGTERRLVSGVFLFGQILLAEGDLARGLALCGLARAHPALESWDLADNDQELAKLGLPPDELETGLAAGAALDFETVVQEILDGKW